MKTLRLFALGCSLLFVASCGNKPAAPQAKDDPLVNEKPPVVTAEMIAKLAKADAADGKVDKVVSKCAGCQLHMDGLPENSAKIGDYTMHFCKTCAGMVADPAKALMALKE